MRKLLVVPAVAFALAACSEDTIGPAPGAPRFDHNPNHVLPTLLILAPADGAQIEYDFIDPSANILTITVRVTRIGGEEISRTSVGFRISR